MEEILKSANKIIIDKSVGGQNGVLPYLPLPSLPGVTAAGRGAIAAPSPARGSDNERAGVC